MGTTLPDHAERFLLDSSLVQWDSAVSSSVHLDPEWSRMMHVVAGLEADTAITARCAHTLGIDRSDDIAAFVPVWAAEEAEHARPSGRCSPARCTGARPRPRPRSPGGGAWLRQFPGEPWGACGRRRSSTARWARRPST